MCADSILLDDSRMQSFIADGYTVVKTDLSADFHQSVYGQIEEVLAAEGNPGNNLLPRIPDLQQVFDQPEVAGALTSILGPGTICIRIGFAISTSRVRRGRGCTRMAGAGGTTGRAGRWPFTIRRTRRPSAVPPALSPAATTTTASTKGMRSGVVALAGEAGTVAIVHYDLWHRARPNSTEQSRYMVKFLFVRLEEPDGPSWDATGEPWTGNGHAEAPMWHSVWEWYGGQSEDLAADTGDQAALLQALMGNSEAASQAAAYALGRAGEPAVGPLMDCLRQGSEYVRRNAGYGLAAVGSAAVEALAQACADDDPAVRLAAVDCLGDMGRVGTSRYRPCSGR